jgi:beta-galactosidase
MICQNHPAVKEGVRKFFENTAEYFKDEDAILLYNMYWEPNVWGPAFTCKCEYTMKEYVKWLKAKYGSLEKLQKAWSLPIEDWDDIVEFKPEMGLGFPYRTAILDWRSFCFYNFANIIKEGTEAIKRKDPNHPVLSHPVLSMVPFSYTVMSGTDDWLLAKSVDILGTSYYPTIPTNRGPLKPETEGWLYAEMLDALRCAAQEKPFYIAELQTHYRSRYHPLDRFSPEDLSLLCWMSVAYGAKGITMWKWRPFLRGLQLSGRGLTSFDGIPNERAEAVSKVGAILKKHSRLFLDMEPAKAEAAILFNPMTYVKLIYITQVPEMIEYAITSINGFYKALWESNAPVDFIRPEDIREGKLNNYKILYMPFAINLDKDLAEKIIDFVHRGGFVVADSPCALTDDFEYAGYKVMPGAGLDELFRCREIDLFSGLDNAPSKTIYLEKEVPDSGITINITASHPALRDIEVGSTLHGSLYKEKLKVLPGGEILGTFEDGSPAIIASSYGKGGAIFAGTCLGRSYFKYNEETCRKIITGVLKWAGVMRPVEIMEAYGGKTINLRLHNYEKDKILFVLNLSKKHASLKLGLRLPGGKYSCSSLMENVEVPVSYENGFLTIKSDVPSLDVKIYYVKGE